MISMGCIQDTIAPAVLFTALGWDGLAPDTAFSALPPVLGRRLSVAAGHAHEHCGGSELLLVASEPSDPSLPDGVRGALGGLAPGRAVAAHGLPELADGWVAMPGLDIKVTGTADLGDEPVVAVTLGDMLGLLTANGADRLLVRTVAVVAAPLTAAARDGAAHGGPRPAELTGLAGWHVLADGVPRVPLWPSAHDHTSGRAA